MEWKTIDSAPKDGSYVLTYNDSTGLINTPFYIHRWLKDKWVEVDASWFTTAPTHWMPLPKPPKAE